MDLKLGKKKAFITGGSQGIGLSIATQLAQENCSVTIASRSEKNLAAARAQNPDLATLCLDIADEDQIRKALKGSDFDILVVNSGGPQAGFMRSLSLSDWDKSYRLLLRSLIVLTELVMPTMALRKWGRVLTITSTSALQIIGNLPMSGTFRAGLSAWVKHAAKEYGREGVLLNNLLPGPTNTSRLNHLKEVSPATVEAMKKESAVGRFAEPDEIARVAVFLLSGANTYVTGTDVLVDGGFTTAL